VWNPEFLKGFAQTKKEIVDNVKEAKNTKDLDMVRLMRETQALLKGIR
jgi:hypothetical protein